MPKRICTIAECSKPAKARGWCNKHYKRWQAHGDPEFVLVERPPMPDPDPCIVEGCDLPGTTDRGNGLCFKHYRRLQRHGSPIFTSRIVGDDVARFEWYVEEGSAPEHAPDLGNCWLWLGALTKDGYGTMASDLPTASAHRWSYRHHVADLPEGLELDHLCRVRACVNPYHLDPVTQAVNKQRANDLKRGGPKVSDLAS